MQEVELIFRVSLTPREIPYLGDVFFPRLTGYPVPLLIVSMDTNKTESEHPTEVTQPDLTADWGETLSLAIGQRMKEARGVRSQEALAEAVGVHANTIGKLERGKASADSTLLVAIARATSVSPAWLLLGEPYPKSNVGTKIAPPVPADMGDFAMIDAYDIEASAGNGVIAREEEVIGRFAFKRSWLDRKGLNPANLVIVTAKGDSMEPTVRSGDILLIDKNITRLASDGIYLIERDNEVYCKRLQKLFNGGVTIMSDNGKYKPQELDQEGAERLHVTGRVVWIGGER